MSTMEKVKEFKVEVGKAHPPGSIYDGVGVNFSIFSRDASDVELLIFDEHDDKMPSFTVKLDPIKNRTFFYWHIYLKGLKPGVHYSYRIDGSMDVNNGYRFNKNKVLIDPYARGNTNTLWDRSAACGDSDNLGKSMRSVVIDHQDYNWEGDNPPGIPMKDLIIYEAHVKGFTRSKTAKVKNPGSFEGLVEKIPYLKELGINAVELLPIFSFDDKEVYREFDGKKLTNYWGYSTIGFLAPHSGYCLSPEEGQHLTEFRDMVKAFHKEGIEVILDVVFNHTSEGNEQGPTINFRGMDNKIYYFLSPQDQKYYMNYSGCGNTVDCNHPIVEKMIIDCLEFWVKEMHVDGFRFDEGSILTRGINGSPEEYPPVLWELELSETFTQTKLIAEAWDAGGLYQVGDFPGYRWAEWNGLYRDTVRRFVKGDGGMVGALASKIAGSADIFQQSRHKPINSINFITCHDGFTMIDLVSYNYKHNYANGENNNDGANDNNSWNCGVEGETENQQIIDFRKRQIKNFVSILMLSQGVPMLLSGDEVGRTQKGNNNAYCQDNDISWFDWDLVNDNKELLEYFKKVIHFRKSNSILRRGEFFNGAINERGIKDISWHGCKLFSPNWGDKSSKVLSFTMGAFEKGEPDLHVMLNADWQTLAFEIPKLNSKRKWYRLADTSLESPDDFMEKENAVPIKGKEYLVNSYSSVILISM